MIINVLLAFVASFLVTAIVGCILVPALRKMKAGQSILEIGPVWHMSKQGTPTMGGLMFICGIFTAVIFALGDIVDGNYIFLIVFGFALIYAFVGFLDDYQKLRKKQNLGLTALQKFLLQLVAAIVLILLLRKGGHISPNLYIPFFNTTLLMPEWLYYIFAAFIIVGTVNAVNITDGVDGLVTGVSIPVGICCAAVAVVWGYLSVGVFAAALAGGLAAFLIFNFHPAKVFMGDTGSLFLGGAVCALAFALDAPLILIPLGIVYIIETLSDIIQVTYFKLTHGKRVFKMAPLHHHFEMCGWSEYKLFAVFTGVSAIFAIISFLGLYSRYMI